MAGRIARGLLGALAVVGALAGCGSSGGDGGDRAAAPLVATQGADPVTAEAATVHATVNPNGAQTQAWFEWGTDPSLASARRTPDTPAGTGTSPVAVSAELTGLTPGTTYYVRAAGSSEAGAGQGDIEAFVTLAAPPGLSTHAVQDVGRTVATLHAAVNPNGADTQAWFEWGTDPSLASARRTPDTPVGSGTSPVAVSAELTDLTPGTTYYVRAAGSSAAGAGQGSTESFSTEFLAPEIGPAAAEDVTQTTAIVRASVNANGADTTWWIEWTTSGDTQTAWASLGSGRTASPASFQLIGLSPDTAYSYRLLAANSGGTASSPFGAFRTAARALPAVTVNSLEDLEDPPAGTITLRAGLAQVDSGGTITFDPALDGGTVRLTLVDRADSPLKGEVFSMSQGRWVFEGYRERNYGRSALYAAKEVTIDASGLPGGVTLAWAGGDADPARVLAVYGNLTLRNVHISSGHARAAPLAGGTQPYTLARGGGLAVWGVADLEGCTVSGNRVAGDAVPSRDRGAFGGGIYANTLLLRDCVISGNAARGYGAAGGGAYSVGGAAESSQGSHLTRCAVTGNRVTGQHAYGGGLYTDGGGPGGSQELSLENCTVARNLVEDNPDIPEDQRSQYYCRGGGVYMSNGYLSAAACTIAENAVTGHPYPFGGKPNLAGGGIAATIGNAHVVEDVDLSHSVVAGNAVNGSPDDVFTGSLLHFYSGGYNLIGRIDFRYILVPVGDWLSLSRRHAPQVGDEFGAQAADVLALDDAARHPTVRSAGIDAGEPTVLWYPPAGPALDRIPAEEYSVEAVAAGYSVLPDRTDDFLNQALAKIRALYGDVLGPDFGAELGDLAGLTWYGPAASWPSNPANLPWIEFWHDLDAAVGDRLGPVPLGDEFWGSFESGPAGDNVELTVERWTCGPYRLASSDQRGSARPAAALGDVGAVEW